MIQNPCAKILNEEFSKRQRKNPSYSLRSFAKYLDIDPSSLSAILGQKRLIPKAKIKKIADKLELSPLKRKLLLDSKMNISSPSLRKLSHKKINYNTYTLLSEEAHFKIISEWEHQAILSLIETNDFQSEINWISKRLNLTEARTKDVLTRLEEAKLIKISSQGRISLLVEKTTTTSEIPSAAIRLAHKDSINVALEKLDTVAVENRFYSTTTIAISRSKIAEGKIIIQEFKQKLSSLLESESKDEVYNLGIQLYPLTELGGESK